MKKVIFVILMFFGALLANDEYHIFVSAFGDDVSEKAIESARVAVERKVGDLEGVEKVVSGKFGRYRAIAIRTKPLSGEKIKILINKIKFILSFAPVFSKIVPTCAFTVLTVICKISPIS